MLSSFSSVVNTLASPKEPTIKCDFEVLKATRLVPGDHIRRLIFSTASWIPAKHHGVYVGDGMVVDLQLLDESNNLFDLNHVRHVTLEEFQGTNTILEVVHQEDDQKLKTLARAMEARENYLAGGERPTYNLLPEVASQLGFNDRQNCEAFVEELKGNESASKQESAFLKSVAWLKSLKSGELDENLGQELVSHFFSSPGIQRYEITDLVPPGPKAGPKIEVLD